ncbi:MAG: hypothetical protein SGPRY_014475, partial [Prymnesium sp.]
ISDCDTIPSVSRDYHYTATIDEAAAASLEAGGDISCGPEYARLTRAFASGLISQSSLERAVRRVLTSRMLVGDLDPHSHDPYARIGLEVVDSREHRELATQMSRESVVLLKRGRGFPLRDRSKRMTIALLGPSADDPSVQAHTYHGSPNSWLTLEGSLRQLLTRYPDVTLLRAAGCDRHSHARDGFDKAMETASTADAIVFVGGLDAEDEEEDTDRTHLRLPGVQGELVLRLARLALARGVPLAVVIYSGGPIAEPSLVSHPGVDSIFWSSYSGQTCQGMAEALLGLNNPSGCLPFTIPHNESQLGAITDYSMSAGNGRTYRYLNTAAAPPLFPFGYGLSFSKWSYADLITTPTILVLHPPGTPSLAAVSTRVTNQGALFGMLTIQLYARFDRSPDHPVPGLPLRQLLNFTKLSLKPGATTPVQLEVDVGSIISIRHQTLPTTLHLWVGNADESAAEATCKLKIELASTAV